MKILIIGASSYVGARLYIDLKKDFEVVGTYSSNKLNNEFVHLDIINKKSVIDLIENQKPDIVIHVANNASGGWCDSHPEEAFELNQNATNYIVEAAKNINAKLIYISSFAVLTNTVYGKTKKGSEDIILSSGIDYCILRPSLIIGLSPNTTNDRPFNRMLKNIDQKTSAIYDSSWKFQPTSLGHLSSVIHEVITRNLFGYIIHVACPEISSRYMLAKDILTPFGVAVNENDLNDTTPFYKQELVELKELQLPELGYDQLIKQVVGEIKER